EAGAAVRGRPGLLRARRRRRELLRLLRLRGGLLRHHRRERVQRDGDLGVGLGSRDQRILPEVQQKLDALTKRSSPMPRAWGWPLARCGGALTLMAGRCRCAPGQSTNGGRSEAMGVPDAGRAGRALVRTARTIACCLAFSAALPAVSSADGRGPVTSLLEMRRDRVVVQQWDLSCGAAALATLLNYQHGDAVSEREVARGLIQREEYLEQPLLVQARQGFSLLDLKRYVEQRGYRGIGYGQLTLADLIERAPAIVPVRFHG